MREDNAVLILDACNQTAGILPITYNPDSLPDSDNAGITTDGKNQYKASERYVTTTTLCIGLGLGPSSLSPLSSSRTRAIFHSELKT